MSDQYFVLHGFEGPHVYGPFSAEELLREITPDEDGYTAYGADLRFLDTMPKTWDFGDDDNPIIIVKGSIVVPRPINVVTRMELP